MQESQEPVKRLSPFRSASGISGSPSVSQTRPEQRCMRHGAWSWEVELRVPGCLGRRSEGYFVYTTLCSWFKAPIFVFFSLTWTAHFNFMNEQFEIDWGKNNIFHSRPGIQIGSVNRRGVGLIFEEADPRAVGARVSFGLAPSQGEMTKTRRSGAVSNRCAGTVYPRGGLGCGGGLGHPGSQLGGANGAALST